uniref:F-box domain-containing protein n=1 Tax=Oryza punctata TaxID=4537 RepID=A0A0E0M2Z7_ORYPU
MAKRKGTLLQGGDSSQSGKRLRYSGPDLPEDIWRHIHFLMPLRDAARAACISQAFLRSWRHHPNLILTKKTMGLEQKSYRRVGMAGDFTSTVHSILKNHSGIGVKRLKLDIIYDHSNLKICYLNNWLQIAITPGIEEITLLLPSKYTFPCSLLSGGNGRSLQYLKLVRCAFRPTASLGFLSSLTKLHLCEVRITDDELTCLISKSLTLKQLELLHCRQIICLKIPCLLEQLSCLNVSLCENLQMIESKAPNLSTFTYIGNLVVELSLGQSSEVKTLDIDCSDESNFLCYVITKLPNIVPNLETLTLHSIDERINTPMVASKFLHLKRLEIYFDSLDSDEAFPPEYDYLSLVSILDASPVLDTFILSVQQGEMKHDSVFGDDSNLRTMPGHKHESLKDVEIIGFCSATTRSVVAFLLDAAAAMGMLALTRLMAAQRDRRRRKAQARNGAITSMAKRKGTFLQRGDSSQGGKRLRYSGPYLTEDIWCHIHSLMPLRDAARAACVSQAFLHSWRRYPNLIFTVETLGLEQKNHWKVHMARYFTRVDHILKNHSGIGVKRFELHCGHRKLNICRLNNWLQIAITSGIDFGIEEITLSLPLEYSFPCSLLSGGSGRSLQHLELVSCTFSPMAGLGCSRNLTKLHLHSVLITNDELACFLSESFALKHLDLYDCREIVYLKIPCLLEQLRYLDVSSCNNLQMIETKAPNLSSLRYSGDLVEISLGQSSQVKTLDIDFDDETNFLCYVITKLRNIVSNLESLTIHSHDEVQQGGMKHDSVPVESTTNLRTMLGHKHERLKEVMIVGFCSATSMVELTCHILENATSLETITLDTVCDIGDFEYIGRCCTTTLRETGSCYPLRREMILEAHRGVMAIERYIRGKVPSNVELTVREPCTWCHDLQRLDALEKENGSHSPPHLKLENISLLLKPV